MPCWCAASFKARSDPKYLSDLACHFIHKSNLSNSHITTFATRCVWLEWLNSTHAAPHMGTGSSTNDTRLQVHFKTFLSARAVRSYCLGQIQSDVLQMSCSSPLHSRSFVLLSGPIYQFACRAMSTTSEEQLVQLLSRLGSSHSPVNDSDTIAAVGRLLDRFAQQGGSVAALVVRLAQERNVLLAANTSSSALLASETASVASSVRTFMPNPNYQSHQNHPRKERISSKKHSDSDTDSDNFVPSDDSEAIDPLPSKAQVRRSILSVVNRLSILSASAHEVPLPGDNTSSFLLGAVATTPVSPVSISSISLNQNHPAHAPRNSSASSPGGTLSRSTNMNLLSPISVSSQEYFNPFASVSAPERSHSLTNTHPSPKMESTSDVESPTTTLNLSMRRERNGSHDSKITTPSETSTQEFNLATHAVNVAINNNYHQNNVFVIPKRDQSTRLSAAILSDSSVFTASSSFESDVHATVASSVTVIRPARSTSEGASMSETVILEGFLVKKMNVFAREKEHIADSGTWGWKPRYFKLKEVSLEEYDSKTNVRVSAINLRNCSIVAVNASGDKAQSSNSTSAFAFTITEHKSSIPAPIHVRHTLCTHSQADRDIWVDAINLRIVAGSVEKHSSKKKEIKVDVHGATSSATTAGSSVAQAPGEHSMSPKPGPGSRSAINMFQEGGSAAVGVARRGLNLVFGVSGSNASKRKVETPRIVDPEKVIFGAPLERGVQLSKLDPTVELCSVVFRCIEFLEKWDSGAAIKEEGIYRLSGSASTIQSLKLAFDLDFDVNLLKLSEMEILDVHAVTGLLKLYLRELPDSVLGHGEVKRDIVNISNLIEKADKVKELARVLPLLPDSNYALLKHLSAHLQVVIQASNVNKMSMSNLSIVFSPTLSVPGGLLQVMVLEHEFVFLK